MANNDTKNVKLGICLVSYDGVDLGFTKGGVDVAVETQTQEITVDQFGQTPIGEMIMGRTVTATVPLAETTLENLVKIMPGATLATDAANPQKKKVVVPTGVGTNLLTLAKPLVLHPKEKALSDKSDDFTIPLASTGGALQYAYKFDEQRVFNVVFKGYPDGEKGTLFIVGDSAVA